MSGFRSRTVNKTAVLKTKQLRVNDRDVLVEWKRVKYLRVKIKSFLDRDSGKPLIRVSSPVNTSESRIVEFIHQHEKWLQKHLSTHQHQVDSHRVNNWEEGDAVRFEGTEYRLKIIEVSSTSNSTSSSTSNSKVGINIPDQQVDGGTLELMCRKSSGRVDEEVREERREIFEKYCKSQLELRLPDLFSKWEMVIGVSVKEWRVRRMKTRWGSCNIKVGRIWINTELMKRSHRCLEYVVVHELVHLLERYHNQRFYGFMTKFLPNWKAVHRELNELNDQHLRLD